jgi:cell filamentation protein
MKDPYINENGVLKNKLNIKNYEDLNKAEADIGFIKLIDIDSVFKRNNDEFNIFDADLLKKIHKHIFEDIFDWAGEYRTVPIIKEEVVLPGYSIPYSDYKNISKDLNEKLNELNSISWQNLDTHSISMLFARKMALLWKVHPFRDGNTRTMLSFAYLYAKEHSFPFDMKTFTDNLNRTSNKEGKTIYSIRDKFVLACLDEKDYPEVEHLAKVFEIAIKTEDKKKLKTF